MFISEQGCSTPQIKILADFYCTSTFALKNIANIDALASTKGHLYAVELNKHCTWKALRPVKECGDARKDLGHVLSRK